jgi:hypothetical protein
MRMLTSTVRGDRKNMLEIKEIFNEVYHAPVHLVALGSAKELYKEVQELFNNNPGDVMRWAPKCVSERSLAFWIYTHPILQMFCVLVHSTRSPLR